MNYFMYLAFGDHRFKKEALYSILSLKRVLHAGNHAKIVLYTDNPTFYQPYFTKHGSVIIEELDRDQIEIWANQTGYKFITKIKAIKMCVNKYNGKVLFVDSDVVFIKNPMYLFKKIDINQFIMFMHCTSLGDALKSLHKFPHVELAVNRKAGYKKLVEGIPYLDRKFQLDTEFTPHNSGFIGLDTQNRHLVNEVESIVTHVFPQNPLVSLEEVAFSAVFQQHGGRIMEVYNQYISFHYLGQKYARLLVGYVLDCLTPEDNDLLNDLVEEYQLYDLETYEIDVSNLQIFCAFLDSLKSSDRYNEEEFELMATYVRPDELETERKNFQSKIAYFFRIYYRNQLTHTRRA